MQQELQALAALDADLDMAAAVADGADHAHLHLAAEMADARRRAEPWHWPSRTEHLPMLGETPHACTRRTRDMLKHASGSDESAPLTFRT